MLGDADEIDASSMERRGDPPVREEQALKSFCAPDFIGAQYGLFE